MSSYENLLIEDAGAVRRISLSRPKALNALSSALLRELLHALGEVPTSTRVLVLTGAGEKAFAAGADIAEMAGIGPAQAVELSALGHAIGERLRALPAIVIAEVNGFALGGGCELMLACDFAIAADTAKLGQPEVTLGVTAGFGGTTRLARAIGRAAAIELLATGRVITADRARELGLVNEVVPRAELRARVDAIAAEIAKNAPLAVALSKRSVHHGAEVDLGAANAFEQQVFGLCFATADQKEGMKAFVDKRKPAWTGA